MLIVLLTIAVICFVVCWATRSITLGVSTLIGGLAFVAWALFEVIN